MHLPSRKPLSTSVTASVVLLAGLALSGCSRSTTPTCTGDSQSYKGSCLSATAVTFLTCTDGKGFSSATEINGALGGSFKVVADASLKAAYTKSKQEDTPVALEIVQDCFKIAATASPTSTEAKVATSYESQTARDVAAMQQQQVNQTPHLTLSQSQAAIGEPVQVTGTNFWPNETVDIYIQATLVKQVAADAAGHFATTITIPHDAPPPDFSTTIHAAGETSAESASAPFST